MGLEYSSIVDGSRAEVFAWHERPGALPRLAPPWQPLKVVQEATSLVDGQAVLQLPGGLRWVAQHSDDEPPRRFVDELVSLPLPWRHIHTFEEVGTTRTRVVDRVETPVPARFLLQTFRYRHRQLADDLASHRRLAGPALTVGVTGSSGLIGSALCAFLSTGGHRVVRLVRRPPRDPSERSWDTERPDPGSLEGLDAIVHLAGASIAGRFTAAHKRQVRDSRVGPTAALAAAMAGLSDGPRLLVCRVGHRVLRRGAAARRSSPRTVVRGAGSWPRWSRNGRPLRIRRGPPASGSCTCARASCSRRGVPASSCSARCSRPVWAARSPPVRSGCRGSISTTSSTSSGGP